ncbi:MAG: hypothetical protein WC655_00410 [Candidatus Hydrogenedentales bacterium]
MDTHAVLLIGLLVVNIPLYYLLVKLLFGNLDAMSDAVRLLMTPDVVSWFRGEGMERCWAEMKLVIWIFACTLLVLGEYLLIGRYVFP